MKTFSFIKNQKIFFGIVAVVFIIGIVSFFTKGFNVDIDFVGGSEITYDLNKTVTKDDEAAIEKAVTDAIGSDKFSSIRVSGENVIIRTLVADSGDDSEEVSATIEAKMSELHPEAILSEGSTAEYKVYTLPAAESAEGEEAVATEWAQEDVDAITAALADVAKVTANGGNLEISFTPSSEISKLREQVTETVTMLYDNTDEISANVDGKVAELFASAVLSDTSTAENKEFTMATEQTDEEGNAVLYTWTEDDKTALDTAFADAGLADVSVTLGGTSLYVDFVGSSSVEWLSTDSVSAEVSEGLRNSAVMATVAAVILMLIYIAIRFQFSSALSAVVCLVHDLFVMITAYSLFEIPVNSTIIAAMLTILGYSINATIIIFDRIRENDKKFADNEGFGAKVDDGIRKTLMRSVNTTLTTLFTIGMIYLLGVTSIKNFALPLIVGILAGLFSSVCLAGPVWRLFKKLGKKIRNR